MITAETDRKPGPIDILFAEDEKMLGYAQRAEEILKGIVKKELSPDALEELFADPVVEEKLTSASDSLDGKSPLAVIRAEIEKENQAIATLGAVQPKIEGPQVVNSSVSTYQNSVTVFQVPNESIITSPFPKLGRSQQRREEIFSSRSHRKESPFGKIAVITSTEDICDESIHAEVVHLGNQSVVNISTIEAVLEISPNLRIIQMPKSYLRLMGPGIKNLLEQRGIHLRIGRIKEASYYDEPGMTKDYKDSKKAFDEMQKDPSKKHYFDLMLKYNFVEAEVALMYFGSDRISIRQISEQLGLREYYAQRRFNALMCWAGKAYKEAKINQGARNLTNHIDQLEKATRSKENFEQFRERYKVGDQYPPESLPIERWELWQKITEIRQKKPQILNELMQSKPRWVLSLAHFFHLDGVDLGDTAGSFKNLDELAGHWGISHQASNQYKNKALRKLGLLEE